jgi:GNAT superfamily N-acetyltransferase
VPVSTPEAWRDRWANEAARYGQAPIPETFEDLPNAGLEFGAAQEAAEQRSLMTAISLQPIVLPRLLIDASLEGLWDPMTPQSDSKPGTPQPAEGTPEIIASVDALTWSRLTLCSRVITPSDPSDGHDLVAAVLRSEDAGRVSAAVVGTSVVGLAVSGPIDPRDRWRYLLALGVAPGYRRKGLAKQLLRNHVVESSFAAVSLAERDVFAPMPRGLRAAIARRLLESAGYKVEPWSDLEGLAIDPGAIVGRRR